MVRIKGCLFRFSKVFRDRGLLQDTTHLCVEEQVAMFLNTVGHNLKNRLVSTNFDRFGETVSCYFNKVLRAIGELRDELIRPSSMDMLIWSILYRALLMRCGQTTRPILKTKFSYKLHLYHYELNLHHLYLYELNLYHLYLHELNLYHLYCICIEP